MPETAQCNNQTVKMLCPETLGLNSLSMHIVTCAPLFTLVPHVFFPLIALAS